MFQKDWQTPLKVKRGFVTVYSFVQLPSTDRATLSAIVYFEVDVPPVPLKNDSRTASGKSATEAVFRNFYPINI